MDNLKSSFQSLAQKTKICRIPILEFFNSICYFEPLANDRFEAILIRSYDMGIESLSLYIAR